MASQSHPRHWVITPFNKARNRPPQPAALQAMLAKNQALYLTSVPSRYRGRFPGSCPLAELVGAVSNDPPGDYAPARDCVVHLSYDQAGNLLQGIRLPGTLAVLP